MKTLTPHPMLKLSDEVRAALLAHVVGEKFIPVPSDIVDRIEGAGRKLLDEIRPTP